QPGHPIRVIQPDPLAGREDIMTDTKKWLAIVTDTRGAGVRRATEQSVTVGMAGRADSQRATDFQAMLLAMAGHDLRLHCNSFKAPTSFSASGPNPSKISCGRVSTQTIGSVGSSIDCWGLFACMS